MITPHTFIHIVERLANCSHKTKLLGHPLISKKERKTGLEPATSTLGRLRSTN